MRISDWSSDVCSSDLDRRRPGARTSGRNAVEDRQATRICRQGGGTPGTLLARPVAGMSPRHSRAAGHDPPASKGRMGRRSEERRVGKECAVRVDLGGSRIIKKKNILIK